MYLPTDPLIFPPHFPPTKRWEKFFVGVRWLGPDLSFFKKLKLQQADRTPEQMKVWGFDERRGIAEELARGFKKEVHWPSAVFLPNDSFQVMCSGPAFGMLDDLGSFIVFEQLEKQHGIRIPKLFWSGRESSTFGEIVDALTGLLRR